MKESIRTLIILLLIAVSLWFIYWIRHQSEETLQQDTAMQGIFRERSLENGAR